MDPFRTEKLNQAILKVLCDVLQADVKDPRVGFVTINEVRLNRDHSVADVLFSVLGDEQEREDSFTGLKKARGFLQSRLGRILGVRQTPELRFAYDDSLERSYDLDNVLDDMEARGEFLSDLERKRRLVLADLVPPTELVAALHGAEILWIVPHFNPDPDAVGSALALAEALESLGKEVRVVGYVDPPVGIQELPGFDTVDTDGDYDDLYALDEPDTLVLVDCHRIDRSGPMEDTLSRFPNRWCIDHHLISGRKGPEPGWVDPRACSTCTLVHQVIAALHGQTEDAPLTVDMATNLYAGLLNDTGGFRFDNTLPFSFELARRLAEAGVDTAQVAARTLHRQRPEGVAIMQHVLGTFSYHARGKVVVARATRSMLAETGAVVGDTEGFVNLALSVDGVQMAAFMKETDEQKWRVSLRCRPGGDVQQVAARHGGGGHKQAAGCDLHGDADEVVVQLAADLTAALP
ncbi:30S ribosome-binding factor RbfA [bacterium]|nr:MAG: 30S ribosome-binding factor RbfA [bacterium]